MPGLYIHIPFCASRCIYCGFYSTTRLDLRQRYVDALCRELELHKRDGSFCVNTVYLGGGTPSQLTTQQLRQLFLYINKVFSRDVEVTIEANPDDVSPEYAAVLRQLGINRVSMGAQTFDNSRLRFLHRRHTASQVVRAVDTLRQAGIGNISIDLMYGFPDETIDDWHRDIDAALALHVEHLSAYCLMIEEGTPLYRMMHREDGSTLCDEETERTMYEMLIDQLTAAGYEHYEISNFARPGYRSRHNSSYWNGTPYIGLGAAAHSYDGLRRRQWNVDDLQQYIQGIETAQPVFDFEELDDDTLYNEQVMTSLRTCEGLSLPALPPTRRAYCLSQARSFLDGGLLRLTDDERLVLTRNGLFVSNMVMSSLMQVPPEP